jgi:hypothetical protein
MKTCMYSVIIYLGIRWKWLVSFTPRPLYPREKFSQYPWDKGYVGPRTVLNTVEMMKATFLCRESNPGHPASRYIDLAN